MTPSPSEPAPRTHADTRAVLGDANARLLYESNKKSVAISYLLWFFCGTLGGHRFYNGRIGSGLAVAAMGFISFLLAVVGFGSVPLLLVGLWVLVDAFLIPGWVSRHNNHLAHQLGVR